MKMKPSKINPLIYYVEKWLNDLPKKFEHRKFFLSMSNHSSALSMSRLRRSVLIKKNLINFFHASFLYPLITSEKQRFSDDFSGYRKRPVA